MRFIHVSDVHLGMVPDKGKPWSDIRAKEIEDTFDKILEAAEEKKVDQQTWQSLMTDWRS